MMHRDDLPFEVVEKMEAHFAEIEPGKKLVFAGDLPEGSAPELEDAFREMSELAEASFQNGTCLNCLSQMPDYEIEKEDWEPAEGWQLLESVADHQQCWICDGCDRSGEDDPEDFENYPDNYWNGLKGDFE